MLYLTLLVLAIAPGISILWYVYNKDKYEKEPKKLVVKTFFLGACFTIPAGLLEVAIQSVTGISMEGNLVQGFIGAYFFVAPIEEYAKYLAIKIKAFKSSEMNEVMDGIVYGVAAAMGFATLENIAYVFEYGIGTGVMRALLSVPGHGIEGAIIGYYLGVGKMKPRLLKKNVLTGLTIAILFHGTFDFFVFSGSALAILVIPLVFFMYLSFRKRVRLALENSRFRDGRDPEEFPTKVIRMTTKGGVKIASGIILLAFAALFLIGSVAAALEEDWGAVEYIVCLFFVVFPAIIGISLIVSSRKDRVEA